jgi:hypothetical protein
MPPKRKMSDVNNANVRLSPRPVKRDKRVMTLLQKIDVLDRLASGMGASVVGRQFGVNESTVRYIKKKEKQIRDTVGNSAPVSANVSCVVRDRALVKTEKALSSWIEYMQQEKAPVDQNMIREKALCLYEQYRQAEGSGAANNEAGQQTFNASKGWFEKFKKRIALRNVNATYIETVHKQISIIRVL